MAVETWFSSIPPADQGWAPSFHRLEPLSIQLTASSEHHIAGDVLCMLDSESLKTIGVTTVGQRIAILKAIYQAKVAHRVPFESHHYVPPCR